MRSAYAADDPEQIPARDKTEQNWGHARLHGSKLLGREKKLLCDAVPSPICCAIAPVSRVVSFVTVLSRLKDPPAKASSFCARFCRGARFCQSRSLPPLRSVQRRGSGCPSDSL